MNRKLRIRWVAITLHALGSSLLAFWLLYWYCVVLIGRVLSVLAQFSDVSDVEVVGDPHPPLVLEALSTGFG